MVVMDRYLGAAKARRMNFPNHFNADHTTVLCEIDSIKNRSSEKSKVAVDISEWKTKQHFDGVMVDTTDDNTVKRVRTADLATVDEINVGCHLIPQ
jgi:hypothetical protein